MVIARESKSLPEALGVAALLPKAADTLPAMVGALMGASLGAGSIPATWRVALEESRGICIPSTKGLRVADIASGLLESVSSRSRA
jgi:hypothetical protein